MQRRYRHHLSHASLRDRLDRHQAATARMLARADEIEERAASMPASRRAAELTLARALRVSAARRQDEELRILLDGLGIDESELLAAMRRQLDRKKRALAIGRAAR